MNYSSEVREFVVGNFLFGEGELLRADTSLLEEGIIDSTGMLELVFFIEETYGIKIENGELIPENMDNLQSIAGFIARKSDRSPAPDG